MIGHTFSSNGNQKERDTRVSLQYNKTTVKHNQLPIMDNYKIFSTNEEFSYTDYLEYCEMNDITPGADDSYEFHEWCREESDNIIECEFCNLEYSKAKDYPFYVEGTLGLWNGSRDGHFTKILWGVKNALWETITSCRSGYDDYDAELDIKSGAICVNCYHHDGCNTFTIHRLSNRGEQKVQRDIDTGAINDYDYDLKSYCYRKLKKEDLW